MESSVIRQIHRLRQLTVGELRLEWEKLYGAPTRSRNRDYLWKRLAWRIQELEHGGLSGRAEQQLEELAPDSFVRVRIPVETIPITDPNPAPQPRRDPRLPSPGTVITKQYKGRELRVVIRDDGVEYDGAMYGTFTALAKHVTGSKSINGKLFFGLTERKR